MMNISLEGELRILNHVGHDCRTIFSDIDPPYSNKPRLKSGRFNISSTRNKFTMVGCDTFALIRGKIGEEQYMSGCMSLCNNISNFQNGSCSGNGCCQTSIPEGLSAINLTMGSFFNYSTIWEFDPCGYAFVVEESYFNFSSNHLQDLKTEERSCLLSWAYSFTQRRGLCDGLT